MKKKVCALIVTYNRKEYLVKCIEALQNQTVKPSTIIIYDNNSTDGTESKLLESNIIKSAKIDEITENKLDEIKILFYKCSKNLGGSAGFHYGINIAVNQDCDYIWTMDDDVFPDKDCLKNLLNEMKNKRICIPNRTDENFIDNPIVKLNMSNPFKYSVGLRKKTIDVNKLKENNIIVVDMPFEGPIFEKQLVEEVGLPNKDLFIIFDDSEYAYRISQVTQIYFIKNAILHKQIIPNKDKNKLMNWKDYYGYRNQYWFDKKYGENFLVKYLRPLFNHFDLVLRAIIRKKFSNIKVLNAAYYDGSHGLLGKRVEPGKVFAWNKKILGGKEENNNV